MKGNCFISGNYKMCKYMLDIGLPTVSYSINGEATIDHILNKLPNDIGYEVTPLKSLYCVLHNDMI